LPIISPGLTFGPGFLKARWPFSDCNPWAYLRKNPVYMKINTLIMGRSFFDRCESNCVRINKIEKTIFIMEKSTAIATFGIN
jgi:hypothetical protein